MHRIDSMTQSRYIFNTNQETNKQQPQIYIVIQWNQVLYNMNENLCTVAGCKRKRKRKKRESERMARFNCNFGLFRSHTHRETYIYTFIVVLHIFINGILLCLQPSERLKARNQSFPHMWIGYCFCRCCCCCYCCYSLLLLYIPNFRIHIPSTLLYTKSMYCDFYCVIESAVGFVPTLKLTIIIWHFTR